MSKLNEICLEIDKLKKLIENEPEYSKIRKLKIQAEIDELKDERQHMGFKNDHSSIGQINSKIKKLNHKAHIDYEKAFKSKLKDYQSEVRDIIVDYYSDGYTIDDFSADIDGEILKKWFFISNFGKSTGYLFVENISGEFNWHYINPINKVSLKAVTLSDLKDKIINADEVFLKFDDNLAGQTQTRDLKICQGIIDNNLDRLNDFSSDDKSIFRNLKIHADKFSYSQIMELCNIILNKFNINGCSKDFRYILETNNTDEDFSSNIYRNIIENKLIYLENNLSEIGAVIVDLNVYADAFSESQVSRLCDIIDEVPFYAYSADFLNIMKVNRDKILPELYEDFVHDG